MKEPVSQDLLTQMQVARIISERDSKPLPFGWYLEPEGYYAPVFKKGSVPPEPLTAEEAMEKGWKPVYSEYPHTTLASDNLYLVATGETHNGLETYTRHERRPPPLSKAEGPLKAVKSPMTAFDAACYGGDWPGKESNKTTETADTASADYAFGFLDGVASVPVVRSADSTSATASSGEPSPTSGMNMAQRILHVGGRNNAAGYVEFGSVQAVEALVRHVLRDLPQTAQEPVAYADAIAFESAMKAGKGCDVWPAPGDYEKRTGRKLIALTFAVSAASPQPTVAPVELRCDIEPRPLRYPLSDYHRAMSDGPLHYTWEDKPHRLVYDLIAAVRYYASVPTQAVPSKDLSQTLWDNEAVMSLNAELGLPMDQLVKLARAMDKS